MTETTNVLAFRQPSAVDDPLTDIVRAGARDLLARAIEIEVGAFLAPRVTSNSSGCGQSNSSTREAGQGTVSLSLFPGQELQRLL
ncbi:hypothetical protein ACVIU7_008804 [Bradyrhizobium liaoningense]